MEAEADALAPRRSKAADGSIGDASHQAQGSASEHNPDANGIVRALDLTHDPAGGFNAHGWADVLANRGDRRIKYLISRGRIWNPSRDAPGAWRRYTGSNPHNSHLHISVTPEGATALRSWFAGGSPSRPPAPTAPAPAPNQPAPSEEDDDMASYIIAPDGSVWFRDGIWRKAQVATAENPNLVNQRMDRHVMLGGKVYDLRALPDGGWTLWNDVLACTEDVESMPKAYFWIVAIAKKLGVK
ncbi:MAG: hypothetical protein ACOYOQ_00500 [Microthrixaceae bacterium]